MDTRRRSEGAPFPPSVRKDARFSNGSRREDRGRTTNARESVWTPGCSIDDRLRDPRKPRTSCRRRRPPTSATRVINDRLATCSCPFFPIYSKRRSDRWLRRRGADGPANLAITTPSVRVPPRLLLRLNFNCVEIDFGLYKVWFLKIIITIRHSIKYWRQCNIKTHSYKYTTRACLRGRLMGLQAPPAVEKSEKLKNKVVYYLRSIRSRKT